MADIFKKLNWKDQGEIVVLNAPQSFETELEALAGVVVRRSLEEVQAVPFFLAFVTRQAEVDATAQALAPKAEGDVPLWFAYPKGSSKKYRCEFNRDSGWEVLGKLGFEPVRQVAIDEDWSALRFRRVEHIKRMTRSSAMSEQGKERIKKS